MELKLYRQPIINFQESKSKKTSLGMYVKILICGKQCWKNSASATAPSHISSIFQVNFVFFQPRTFFWPGTSFNYFNFQCTYLKQKSFPII